MVLDPRKRQKKLERRAAKRKARRKELIRQKNRGLGELLSMASGAPILHSRIAESLWEEGLGHVMLSRQLPKERVAVAMFLVDRFCLGVKDCYGQLLSRAGYGDMCKQLDAKAELLDHSPADVRKLVEDAVAYARELGFEPHADYHRAKLIFGDIDPRESRKEFEFGQEGKPLFISGPFDSPERCRRIISTLKHSCGPGGYHYLMAVEPSETVRLLGEDDETSEDFEGDDFEDDFDEAEEAMEPPRGRLGWF
jgi:hypothetical protein